jgi:hypothetical protein
MLMAVARLCGSCHVGPTTMGYTGHLSNMLVPSRFGCVVPSIVGLR